MCVLTMFCYYGYKLFPFNIFCMNYYLKNGPARASPSYGCQVSKKILYKPILIRYEKVHID